MERNITMTKLIGNWKESPAWAKLIVYIIVGAVAGFLVSRYVVTRSMVVGSSMEPTYYDGDVVYVCRVISPKRGDKVVVLEDDGTPIIKRVIGMPKDEIQIYDGQVFINGEYYEEDYIKDDGVYSGGCAEGGLELNSKEYFVLGDNRNNSKDSRYIGPIKKSRVLGVVLG